MDKDTYEALQLIMGAAQRFNKREKNRFVEEALTKVTLWMREARKHIDTPQEHPGS